MKKTDLRYREPVTCEWCGGIHFASACPFRENGDRGGYIAAHRMSQESGRDKVAEEPKKC
jgi:hypothetical protein